MDPITIVSALAQFAPQLVKYVTGNDHAEEVAKTAMDVAMQVTGTATGSQALSALNAKPELAIQYQQAVMEQEADLEKAHLADIQSARTRDVEIVKSGAHNYRADAMFLLAVVVVVGLVYAVWVDPNVNEFLKGIVTLMLGRFLGYLDGIYNFEFGTTRGSQSKDQTINNLTKG